MQPEVVAFMAATVFAVWKIVELWILWERGKEE
jgi:hypothetical protein